jgi:8-oxo-dGTP pyrophosphatase MutT (NUDIX family)
MAGWWHVSTDVPLLVLQPLAVSFADAVVLVPGGPDLDPDLLAGGLAHLDGLRATRDMFNGETLCWLGPDPAGGIQVVRGRYFDMLATCDAIRAEGLAGPLRDRATAACGGDPLASGRGRAAAIGVTVLATKPGDLSGEAVPVLTLGRRNPRLATDPGRWHVVPSGMLEAAAGDRHLARTVATELDEELGVTVTPTDVEARATVLGLAHDRWRLRPEIVVRLDLTADEASAAVPQGGEFDAFEDVPVTAAAIDAFLASRGHEPGVTSACEGALRLLRATLAPA